MKPDWEALTNAQKTWTKWKSSFRVAHLAQKYQLLASGRAALTHAGANAATATGPLTSHMSTGTINRLDGYLEILPAPANAPSLPSLLSAMPPSPRGMRHL